MSWDGGLGIDSFNDNRLMLLTPPSSWLPRAGTFAVWSLAAASLAYWGLKISATSTAPQPAPSAPVPAVVADPAAVARLLGAVPAASPAAAPSLASRFTLVGVAAGSSSRGAALIAIDGKPARPFRVGAVVEDGLVLQSVAPRRAVLGPAADGPASLTLEIPLRK